jgi:L-threonylcarbamoyladenylate synthase
MNRIDIKKDKDLAIKKAVKTLKDGGLIVYPTETCYGLGGDATNPKALAKIMEYKTLRGSKPISIAVADRKMAEQYVEINEMADNIYKNYLPGPITVISMSKGALVPPVVSIQGAVGVRYPDYDFTLELIEKFGKPITATSANVSYKSPPYSIDKLLKNLPKKSLKQIELFLDGGQLPKNQPSTVLDTTMNQLSVLWQGKLQFEDALIKNKKVEERDTKTTHVTIVLGKEFSKKYLS